MSQLLIIFDVDGTLVDSEFLCCQALNDLIPTIAQSTEELVTLYRGRKLLDIFADIEHRYNVRLDNAFEPKYRLRVAELFSMHLQPFAGVIDMLESLPFACCIASNGPKHKIRHALSTTGLSQYFGDKLYSAYCVNAWKPDPALFLYAASQMGFSPQQCIVIEDSLVGIQAAEAANMRALRFLPSDVLPIQANTFSHMEQLIPLLNSLNSSKHN
ncbi:HAD-IA family hydrolase [Neptunicella sp. SCSIO 80796]|uniref:HAD-IA family hydrolase n=1 Tax=Neptunicella plasticusilytica TaxID=3117012 RepID=UPI003A4DD7E2